ncbi:MAG: family 16 glycoside hydrolase [Planctomycetales bacterium]
MHGVFRKVLWLGFAWGSLATVAGAAEPKPPEKFRAIFNGKNLTGWFGLNPHAVGTLEGDKKAENLAQQRAEFPKHWSVENDELVNGGEGPYATTDEEFGDIELLLEYKTVAKADSGIYLRGAPQVQIWDWNQPYDLKNPTRKPHLGSGGLFNNTPGTTGRDPLKLADRPFGQWNQFRIRQVGDRTWVWLNDQLVVKDAVMENYYDRRQRLPARGPIMLQTHGGEIRWRNIFVREIGVEEGRQIVSAADAQAKTRLKEALTFHASFDQGLDADYSRGDKRCYVQQGAELVAAVPTDEVRLDPAGGRFGAALQFTKKNNFRPGYKDGGALGYNDKSWNSSVSVWLRLTPDEDLEPGYCDPVQIVGDDSKKGFIFLEWSKDETPRFFRYAIRPLFHIWNPDNVQWADIPFIKRPMVQVDRAPFSRDAWTHVVFSLENVNDKSRPQIGRMHINGALQGTIENWELTFGWDPARVLLVLGAAYVGRLDDLAVFNRALTDAEVRQLYGLPQGVRELRPAP